jgi:ketosteroid isomerase-like protein
MDKTHLMQFADAMNRNDPDSAFEHVSERIVLCSPIFDEAFVGKAEVLRVIQAVKSVIDTTARTGIAEGEDRVVTFNTITLGGVTADTADVIQIDADSLIDRITVMWRPLRAVLEGQNRLADLLGRDKLD